MSSNDEQEDQKLTQDDEVTESTEEVVPQDVNVLLSLEEMIKSNITALDQLREEVKKQSQMLTDAYENNPTYREHTERVKEVTKAKSSVREQIAKQPSVIQLNQKVKDMRSEIKERQSGLSDYLLEYQRLTGATQIEDNEGVIRDIVNSSKLVKRSTPKSS